jgi:quinol monooxygenase YgiN
MSENPIRVVARFKAKPGRIEDLKRVLTGFVAPTRAEDGCIIYDLLENNGDPTDLTFVEEWTSEEALEKHLASEHIARGRAELPELLEGEGDIRVYRQIA